ncbi:DUF5946 family protein [Paenibacillus flagellatus]|uniref:Uncharacterized protein n=1 Tax=Paenibacillus flagellatus TaxID=2211139 RepID=A0A2V5K7U5_9BACL|nr:DUF5946 family protein [Paenibacillus flagellatus]PYI55535.1 hypothetical protein DLM86_07320 [Paenibacillus flagellatus]
MSDTCAKCGADLPEEKTCESIFGELMALEFTDPGYGKVHFLTVACYMVQHEGYSDEMYVWMQSALRNYLEEGYTTEMIRQDASQGPGSSKGIRRQADAPPLPKVDWTMTIVDVAEQMHDAESYCRLIEQWGRTTLKEMGPLLLKSW